MVISRFFESFLSLLYVTLFEIESRYYAFDKTKVTKNRPE